MPASGPARDSQDAHPATLDPLVRDLVEWVAREPRAYAEVMEAWRTSCPRLTVWEDAIDRGLVATERTSAGVVVKATRLGREWLSTGG